MVDLDVGDGYAAALVVANPVGDIALFDAPLVTTQRETA
jgi:hypothetical protein